MKAARGTLRKDRDGAVAGVQLMPAGEPPMMPDYLTPEAKAVWIEEIGRVMVAGTCERDSLLFARYCSLEALVQKAFGLGEAPPAAYLTELRRMGELLGIAGERTRVNKPVQGGAAVGNPFARNGRR